MLNPETGGDPDGGIRMRASSGFEAVDYFMGNYWVFGKMIENLADVGYTPSEMTVAPSQQVGIPSLVLGACKRVVFLASSFANARELITGKLIHKPIVKRTLVEAHVIIRLISKLQCLLGDLMADRTPVPYEMYFVYKVATIELPLQAMRECGKLLGARQFMDKCCVDKQIRSVELNLIADGAVGVMKDFLYKATINKNERLVEFMFEVLDATEEARLVQDALDNIRREAPGPETDARAADCSSESRTTPSGRIVAVTEEPSELAHRS